MKCRIVKLIWLIFHALITGNTVLILMHNSILMFLLQSITRHVPATSWPSSVRYKQEYNNNYSSVRTTPPLVNHIISV